MLENDKGIFDGGWAATKKKREREKQQARVFLLRDYVELKAFMQIKFEELSIHHSEISKLTYYEWIV